MPGKEREMKMRLHSQGTNEVCVEVPVGMVALL
jgi:hypothetical protein